MPKGPTDVRDTKLSGFVLRVRASGTHSYYATWGRGQWKLLGRTDALEPQEARDKAKKALADVWKGKDPIAEQRKAKARMTFATFVTDHYEPWATAQRKTGAEQTARLTALFGPVLNDLCLDEITAFHVERWRSGRLKAGKAAETVNRDLSVLRGALARAVEWNLIATHPLAKVKATKTDRRGTIRFSRQTRRTGCVRRSRRATINGGRNASGRTSGVGNVAMPSGPRTAPTRTISRRSCCWRST